MKKTKQFTGRISAMFLALACVMALPVSMNRTAASAADEQDYVYASMSAVQVSENAVGTVSLGAPVSNAVTISAQPESKTVAVGNTVTFKVTATGSGTLKYQWQYKTPGGTTWSSSTQSGAATNTLSFVTTVNHNGYQYRCRITDSTGEKYSNAVTLTIVPKITKQPESTSATVGSTATFSVTATGKGTLTYQWQAKAPNATEWTNSTQSGAKTPTLSVATNANHNNYQYRCVVTDANGKKSYSSAATLYVLRITTQPAGKTVPAGDTAVFTVAATGKPTLKYQWQAKGPNATEWSNSTQSGATTATLSVATTPNHHGYQYRCIVTDGTNKKVYSNAATLSITTKITKQPESVRASIGSTAKFTVTAAGRGTLTYQWQAKAPGETAWSDSTQSGNKTATLSVKTNRNHQSYQYRCIVTDGSGKKTYTSVATLTLCDIPINETYFPDEVFRGIVSSRYDTDKDGKLSASEITSVDDINLTGSAVGSIRGFEFFSEVVGFSCAKSNVTSVDVSRNTALQRFYCYENGLTSLDVSNNTELTLLSCYGNKLTSLDVSKNTKLVNLYCYENNLTSIDVSKNTALKVFNCKNNKLSSLDVSKNTVLTNLNALGNNLTSLDVSKNTALTELIVAENKLTSLNVTNNTALTYLRCNNNNLKTLDVSKNTALTYLNFRDNALTSIDVSKNTSLKTFYCYGNELTTLDASHNTALTLLNCHANKLTSVNVSTCKSLEELYCHENLLTSIDLRNNTALTKVDFSDNNLTTVDLSNNTALTHIYCYRNALTALDVSKNTALTLLSCRSNNLTSLNLSSNTALKDLFCGANKLTALDVSKNTALGQLSCYNNSLTSLNLSKNTSLTTLLCYNNKLTSLDVSKNTSLASLYCYGNNLTKLDVSGNTALAKLYCNNNKLTSLVLPETWGSTDAVLDCSYNSLSSIDPGEARLFSLNCSNNRLAGLNLGDARVEMLYCYGNSFTSLVIERNDNDKLCYCFVSTGTKVTVRNGEAKIVYVAEN